jgi:hypothetical protein
VSIDGSGGESKGMNDSNQEVYFHQYCKTCKHWKENDKGLDEPCNECLSNPINVNSHKPVKYEEKK